MTDYKKTAVVTGATGMLALALMRKLTEERYKIYAVIRPDSTRRGNIPVLSNVVIVECDMQDYASLPDMIGEKCDVFYHFAWDGTYGAARDDISAQVINIKNSVEAAKAAKALGCTVFVGAGSQAEYGRKNVLISPETPAAPETGYGIAKLCAGQMTRAVCRELALKHIWCRVFSTYGPYDAKHTMVMSGIYKLLAGEEPSYTKGEQQWDYLYCDDAAEAFYLAAQKGVDGSVYCVGSGRTRPLSEYILAIRDAVDPSARIGLGELPYFDKQVMYLCADTSALSRDTGFAPKYSFEDGIRLTVEWAKQDPEGQV